MNYFESVKNDVRENIKYYDDTIREYIDGEEIDRDGLLEALHDEMWIDDSITGNASGSYTMSTYQAEENIAHNFEEIETVAAEWGIEPTVKAGYDHGAEWWDVSIRCYYLSSAIASVLDDMEDEEIIELCA